MSTNQLWDGKGHAQALELDNGTAPAVSAATGVSFISNNGQGAMSEKGGPYIWIKAVDYVNMGDNRFGGLDGSGGGDDTTSINNAIAACYATRGNIPKVLVVPEGLFRVTSPLFFNYGYGPSIQGNGVWDSCFLLDPAVAKSDGFKINASASPRLEGFGINPLHSNPTGKAINFSYDDPINNAAYNSVMRDVQIIGHDANFGFDVGIYWSDLYGNGSEARYEGVNIYGYNVCAVALPGSQQYGHTFYRCGFSGFWDMVTPGVNGGMYGIWTGSGIGTPPWAQNTNYAVDTVVNVGGSGGNFYKCTTGGVSSSSGTGPSGTGTGIVDNTVRWSWLRASGSMGSGSFAFRDGSSTNHSWADFRFDGNTDQPILIDNCDSENSYMCTVQGSNPPGYTVPNTTPPSAPVAVQLSSPLTIANCRIAHANNSFNPDGIINYGFVGPLTIERNTFFSSSGRPRIRLNLDAPPRITVRNNDFLSPGSVDTDPLNMSDSPAWFRAQVDCRNNVFCDNTQIVVPRDEELNIQPPAAFLTLSNMGSSFQLEPVRRMFAFNFNQFTANAASQTIQIVPSVLPKTITYLDFRPKQNNALAFATGSGTVTMKIGTTPGGDELCQSVTLDQVNANVWFGDSSVQRGSAMGGAGGHMPDGNNLTGIYVTLTVSSGTVGNGTTSNFVSGEVHCSMLVCLQAQWFTP